MPIHIDVKQIVPVVGRPNEAHAHCSSNGSVNNDCDVWHTIWFKKEISIILPAGYHFAGKDVCVGPVGHACDPIHSTWGHDRDPAGGSGPASKINIHARTHFNDLEYTLYVQNSVTSSEI